MLLKYIVIGCLFFMPSTINVTCVNSKVEESSFIYWEELNDSQKEEIINSKKIFKDAVAFYKGELKISDDKQSIKLLDTLTSISDKDYFASFYFYLFNQICNKADGALSEILGKYCLRIILNSPDYVVNYFIKNESTLKKYAQFLGYEMYFKGEGTSTIDYAFKDFKLLLNDKIVQKERFKGVLKDFYCNIERSMKETGD